MRAGSTIEPYHDAGMQDTDDRRWKAYLFMQAMARRGASKSIKRMRSQRIINRMLDAMEVQIHAEEDSRHFTCSQKPPQRTVKALAAFVALAVGRCMRRRPLLRRT